MFHTNNRQIAEHIIALKNVTVPMKPVINRYVFLGGQTSVYNTTAVNIHTDFPVKYSSSRMFGHT